MVEAQRISFHVAAWNHQPHLLDLCASLERQSYQDVQAVVSEYVSSRNSASWLQQTYPNVVSLRHFQVQTFATVHNRMIALALARWPEAVWQDRFVVIAHPDVILDPECMARLVRAFEIDRDLVVAGPKMLQAVAHWFEDGEDGCRVEFTDRIESVGSRLDRRRRLKPIGMGETDQGQYRERQAVFSVSSACLMIRASALARLGKDGVWLDETLGEAAAVADLVWRLCLRGGNVACIPSAALWHHAHTAKDDQKGIWSRMKYWYGLAAFTERAQQAEFCLVRVKNEHVVNAVLATPWFIADFFQGLMTALIDPRLWAVYLRTLARLPKMWATHIQTRKEIVMSAKKMREVF